VLLKGTAIPRPRPAHIPELPNGRTLRLLAQRCRISTDRDSPLKTLGFALQISIDGTLLSVPRLSPGLCPGRLKLRGRKTAMWTLLAISAAASIAFGLVAVGLANDWRLLLRYLGMN